MVNLRGKTLPVIDLSRAIGMRALVPGPDSSNIPVIMLTARASLIDRIGVTGKKLHTGRSRNDQVATSCSSTLLMAVR